MVVEVLSTSTEAYDRGNKREHYQRMRSLKAYVLIAQDKKRIEVFSRRADDRWHYEVSGAGESVVLETLGVTFTVDELYVAAGLATLA